VSDKKCDCGRELPLLKEIVGRTTDILEFPNNMVVSGAAVVDMFKYFSDKIRKYQVIQKKEDEILIKIVKDTAYSKMDSELIIKAFQSHVGKNIEINIEFVERIQTTKAGKWKCIVREVA
jgi:phenylacetate-CoA ligase